MAMRIKARIPIEGKGGELGRQMVINLMNLINGLKLQETEEDVIRHYYIICGFATCCEMSGFLTEESANDVMHVAEHLAEVEVERAQREGKGGQA